MKYIAILFFVLIVFVVILADTGHMPRIVRGIYDFPYGDKLGHFVLFGFLNFFIVRAFLSSNLSKSPARVSLGIGLTLALLIALEEYSQQYFSTRTFDLVDLFASYVGLFIGGWAASKIKRPKGSKTLRVTNSIVLRH